MLNTMIDTYTILKIFVTVILVNGIGGILTKAAIQTVIITFCLTFVAINQTTATLFFFLSRLNQTLLIGHRTWLATNVACT
jgi:hypothetical protein